MCVFQLFFDAAENGHFWFCLKINVDMEWQTEDKLSLFALKAENTY